MKEITRIHIAKVPYDVELSAKKALEQYMSELSNYAADAELLQDIEVRMTELLAERGVGKDDIISDSDVQAVRAKLGEPEAFIDDESDAIIPADEPSRRLYRDQDEAVVGGVLSGIAAYFRISPLWTRLAFIISIFISFGTMLLVYIVLWLAVPPARTAGEKLRMTGQPVTLDAIRDVSERDSQRRPYVERRNRTVKRVLTISSGIFSIFVAGCAVTTVVAAGWAFGIQRSDPLSDTNDAYVTAAVGLFMISGLLLVTLAIMGAYASFAQKLNKKQGIAAIVVIILGLGTFGAGIATMSYQSWQRSDSIQRNTKEVTTKLPSSFRTVKTLTINAPNVTTQYVISDTPHMTLASLPNMKTAYSLDGSKAEISVKDSGNNELKYFSGNALLTIYGPELSELVIVKGQVEYKAQAQSVLAVRTASSTVRPYNDSASVSITGGTIDTLTVVNESSQPWTVIAEDASIRHVVADLRSGDTLQLGRIASLTAAYPDVCAAGGDETTINVAGLNASEMTINKKVVRAKTIVTGCATVNFDQQDDER